MSRICIFFSMMILGVNLFSQDVCLLNNYNIIDNTTIKIPIVVTGAAMNSLNSNGPCKINIKFTHTTIGDMNISLISPAGQRIQLLGPGTINSPNTSLTRWDIDFIRCSNAAAPYPTFSARWNNLQPWGIFPGIYGGQYHPFMGCFEDLNTGPINGTWFIEVADVSSRNSGRIECLSLQFCDNTGVTFEPCEPKVAWFNRNSSRLCLGKTSDLTQFLTHPEGIPDPGIYTESMVIFNSTTLYGYSANPDVSSLPAAVYTICPISYRTSDASKLPTIGQPFNRTTFDAAFQSAQICGAVSTRCHVLTLLSGLDTAVVNRTICKGDVTTFNGKSYSTPGTFIDTKTFIDCDSVYKINVNVIDFRPQIEAEATNISCSGGEFWLKLNAVNRQNLTAIVWSTLDGNIVNNSFQDSILIDQAGTYKVVIEGSSCRDSATITITNNFVVPTINFSGNELITCLVPELNLNVTSNVDIVSLIWESTSPFVQTGSSIRTSSSGSFKVTVISRDGCIATDSIQTLKNINLPVLDLRSENLFCTRPSVPLRVGNKQNYQSFEWLKDGVFYSSNPDTLVSGPGMYQVKVVSPLNGCRDSSSVTITRTDYVVGLNIPPTTINCTRPNPTLVPTSMQSIQSYSWTGPSGFMSAIGSPNVTIPGMYNLDVVDNNGCVGSTSINVAIDTVRPVINAFSDVKTCLNTSTTIPLSSINPTYQYRWTGPFGFTSSVPEPTVSDTGSFRLVVTSPNGCTSSMNFVVAEGSDLPPVKFFPDTLTCQKDTITIFNDDALSNYHFDWQTDGLIFNSDTSLVRATLGGNYYVNVIEKATGCSNRSDIEVIDERIIPEISVTAQELNCDNAMSNINYTSNLVVDSVRWSGPQNFTSTSQDISVSTVGFYYVNTYTVQGCILTDTVEITENINSPPVSLRDTMITCDTRTINVLPSTGTMRSYTWLLNGNVVGNAPNLMISNAGTYTLNVVGPNGCPNSASLDVTVDTIAIDIDLIKEGDLQCSLLNPILSVGNSSNYDSISWSSNTTLISRDSVSVNSAGIYKVKAFDSKGCVDSTSITITDQKEIATYNKFVMNIGCDDVGIVQIKPKTLVDSIIWNGPEPIAGGLDSAHVSIPGTYYVDIVTEQGCIQRDSLVVGEDKTIPRVLNKVGGTISCTVPELTIGLAADRTIKTALWSGVFDTTTAVANLKINRGGTYYIAITSTNNCTIFDSIVVIENTAIPQVQVLPDTLNCLVSTINIPFTVSPGTSAIELFGPRNYFRRFGGAIPTTSAFDTGQYVFNAIGTNGCIFRDSFIVFGDYDPPLLDIADTTFLPCDGSDAILGFETEDSIISYRWIGDLFASTDPNPVTRDSQQVTLFVLGVNGCALLDTIKVLPDGRTNPVELEVRNIFCDPVEGRLIANNHDFVTGLLWTFPDGTVSDLDTILTTQSGDFELIVDLGNTCFDTMQVSLIEDNSIPEVDIILTEPFECKNTEVILSKDIEHDSIHRLAYFWTTADGSILSQDGQFDVLVGSEGTYLLKIVDTLSMCVDSSEFILMKAEQTLVDMLVDFLSPACFGDQSGVIGVSNTTGGHAPFTYQLSGVGAGTSNAFDNLPAGNYRIRVVDSVGCELSRDITLNQGFNQELNIMQDTTIRLGDSFDIYFSANVVPAQYAEIEWRIGNQILCDDCITLPVAPTENTTYTLTLTDNFGCQKTKSVNVFILETIDWFLPNIFSPNGDDNNDQFITSPNNSIERILNLSVFDKWGSVVFNAQDFVPGDPSTGWDGKFQGNFVQSGVFVVQIVALLKNNEEKVFVRDLTVLR